MTDEKSNKEILTLVRLLDDPDNKILKQIENKLLSYGVEAVKTLENAWENSDDNTIQKKLENIIHKILFQNTITNFKDWIEDDEDNLLKGYLLVTQYQYPELDGKKIQDQIDKIRQDVWLELNDNLTGLEKIKVLNHILFEIYKFKANISDSQSLQNFYLNNVLDSKKGNHLSLSLVYLIIAQNLELPLYGVNLPEHFILAYTKKVMNKNFSFEQDNEVLFYLNPFKKGAVFTKNEISLFLSQLKLTPDKTFFQPCDNKMIIKRLLLELIEIYNNSGEINKVDDIEIMLKILEK